jgi:3-phosphoshikimate 1-carboxyvinyltransferase
MSAHACVVAERPLDATVALPGSKSITNRALVVAALADGTSRLGNLLLAQDTRIMLDVLGRLGFDVAVEEGARVAEVAGRGGKLTTERVVLHCGNSGTTIRFCAALAALGRGTYTLDGIERMRQRPIGKLVQPIRAQGSNVTYLGQTDFPPIEITGRGLSGGRIGLESPESSQMVSALLMAAPYAAQDVSVEVTGELPSTPYVTMTTRLMQRFGVDVTEELGPNGPCWSVAAPQGYRATDLTIEPDASNATYFLAAAAVAGGRVTVEGLGTSSIQGDARFVDVLERMGCRIQREPARLTVHGPPRGRQLSGVDVDLNDMPDTAQTLAVVALFADGPTVIRNVENLRVKETDRLAALTRELTKLGADVEEAAAGLTVYPPQRLVPAAVATYDDHRMAMSFALAGLRCSGVEINDAGCCAKTFPDFFERFERMIRGE